MYDARVMTLRFRVYGGALKVQYIMIFLFFCWGGGSYLVVPYLI